MNIRYNTFERRFEAEFSQDFNGDLAAIKAAGFRTDGPPAWIWHTQKIAVLNKLRENKPASGLTITPEALEVYKPLALQEEQNQAVKKQLAEVKKKVKKERKKQDAASDSPLTGLTDEKWWIDAEDLPPSSTTYISSFVVPPPPDLSCSLCQQPVYPYEYPEIPMCLWCAKDSQNSA